jgi:hypothetical protein
MSISNLFDKLGAPLANVRWSWGGLSPDSAVVLRVWQNETKKRDGKLWAQLTHHQEFFGKEKDLGYQERNRHVALVAAGAPCYLIMCEARDLNEVPRVIKAFNERELFVAGEHTEFEGNTWVEITTRRPITDLFT